LQLGRNEISRLPESIGNMVMLQMVRPSGRPKKKALQRKALQKSGVEGTSAEPLFSFLSFIQSITTWGNYA